MDREQDLQGFSLLTLVSRLKDYVEAQDRILARHANLIAALLNRLTATDEGRQLVTEILRDARRFNEISAPFLPEDENDQWESWLNVSRRAAAGENTTPS